MKPEAPLNLEELTNKFWQLNRLLEEGHYVAPELESTWDDMVELIHRDDQEKITDLRGRIQDIIKAEKHTELLQKMWEAGWCGPVCLQWIAKKEGLFYGQDELAHIMGTTHEEGTSHEQMIKAANFIGLQAFPLQGAPIEVISELLPTHHVIVNWMDGPNDADDGHYSILKEVKDGMVHLGDTSMKVEDFEHKWYDIEKESRVNRWAMIVKRTP